MNGDTSSSTEPPSQPQSAPEPSTTTSLRQRGTKKKSTRRLSYVVNGSLQQSSETASVSKKKKVLNDAQESVFLNMYIRKMHRRIRGKQSNDSLCCEVSSMPFMTDIFFAYPMFTYNSYYYYVTFSWVFFHFLLSISVHRCHYTIDSHINCWLG